MDSLISFTPDKTAEIEIKCASIVFDITFAILVFPTPGGPHKIIEGRFPVSIATLRDLPLEKIAVWPTISSSVFGLNFSASGIEISEVI